MVFKADCGSSPQPFKTLVMWTPALGRLIRKEMSRSIHWTYKIFKNKSKRELAEMCDLQIKSI